MKTTSLFIFLFVGVSAALAFTFLDIPTFGENKVQAQINTLEPGEMAPTFDLKNIDGKSVSLDNYSGSKGVILVFTANTCPYAIAYEDRLVALDKKFSSKGYPVVAINPNAPEFSRGDSFEKMQEKAKDKGFTFPYLFDEGQKITNQYGARVTPHIFLLQRESDGYKIVYTGAIDNDTQDQNPNKTKYVEDVIASLEAGTPPKVTTTKAIGCTVKRG